MLQGTPLDEYVKNNPIFNGKVKVLHQEKRQGLMRSRMAGIRAATADILVFLDSHIEAGIGWLEPLLFRILEDPKVGTPYFKSKILLSIGWIFHLRWGFNAVFF